jgi:hypothetical protein
MAQTREDIFDTRVVEYNLRRGVITREEYQAFLAELPDDSESGTQVETLFVATSKAVAPNPNDHQGDDDY